jgi:UPF0755 protein
MAEFDRSPEERERARLERERRRMAGEESATDGQPTSERPRAVALTSRPQPRRPAPPSAPRRPRERSRTTRVLAVLALLVVALVIWFLVELFQPFYGSGHGRVTVTIPHAAGTSQVAGILERNGVISCTFPSCSVLFELRAKLDGTKLLAGTYHLQRDMSFSAALTALSTAPPPAKVSNVTVAPGETRLHLSRLLHHQGVAGNYLAQTRHSGLLNPVSYGAPASTPDLEGFLFPDTYQLRVPATTGALVADQLRDFKRQFATVNLSYARAHHLTAYDVLIVGSMVEAEAATEHDRPLIASVIYNRLRLGMPLQIDATVRYAAGNYSSPITESQLHSSSPWNTYVHKGLPPTPIDSPALASIKAAAQPASTNYLYFVVKPCGNGEHAFASSYSQFLQEEQRYQNARLQRGGRSPEHCSSSK